MSADMAYIGVARIFSGGALFSSKKLTTIFSRRSGVTREVRGDRPG